MTGRDEGRPSPAGLPGLQAERTRLAWRRSTLSIAAVLLIGVARMIGGLPIAGTTGVCVIALVLVVALSVAHRRLRALTADPRNPGPAGWAPAALGLLTAVVAVAGAVMII